MTGGSFLEVLREHSWASRSTGLEMAVRVPPLRPLLGSPWGLLGPSWGPLGGSLWFRWHLPACSRGHYWSIVGPLRVILGA
eukprot:3408994-Pyramimonas_sp.AAC.1